MKKYKLSLKDINSNYFHFTLGNNAKYIEETKKVFFVEGLNNLLILFDCWINVYKKCPLLPEVKLTYGLASKLMRSKYFPMFIVDFYFFIIKNSRRHKKYAYKEFDKLFDECILLQLDIKENLDFSFSDIDEIKSKGYKKRHLIEMGYSLKYSDMNSNKMDKWNLHTLSNKIISPSKIKLCYINNFTNIRDIFNYALKNTTLDLKDMCPVLYDYIKSKKAL